MSFLSAIWDAVTYIPRKVVNIASNVVGNVLGWAGNTVGNVLEGLGVASIMTPWGAVTLGGQPVGQTQPATSYFGQAQTPTPTKKTNWSSILTYGLFAVIGIVVIIIIIKLIKK